MYTLTLTNDERQAFDWVGGRYAAGEISSLLTAECMGEDDEWSQDGPITFNIPEWVAWQISELADEDDSRWPCFSEELCEKLDDFINSIV